MALDHEEAEGEIEWRGHRAHYEMANGELYLHHLDYVKAPMKLLLGRDVEDQARWMLKELLREIAAGTATKRAT